MALLATAIVYHRLVEQLSLTEFGVLSHERAGHRSATAIWQKLESVLLAKAAQQVT